MARTAMAQTETACAVIMDFASRYISSPNNLAQLEVDSLTVLMQAAMESKDVKAEGGMLKNMIIMIVNKVNDLPAWFYLDNPNAKAIRIGTPAREERERFIKGMAYAGFFAGDIFREDKRIDQHSLLWDFICSCALRVARDTFALLPVDKTAISAESDGRVVLSVTFDRSGMEKLRFRFIDPSEAVSLFPQGIYET